MRPTWTPTLDEYAWVLKGLIFDLARRLQANRRSALYVPRMLICVHTTDAARAGREASELADRGPDAFAD